MKKIDTNQLDPEISAAYDEFRRVSGRILTVFAVATITAAVLLAISVVALFVFGAEYVGLAAALGAKAILIAALICHVKTREEAREVADALKQLLTEARSTR